MVKRKSVSLLLCHTSYAEGHWPPPPCVECLKLGCKIKIGGWVFTPCYICISPIIRVFYLFMHKHLNSSLSFLFTNHCLPAALYFFILFLVSVCFSLLLWPLYQNTWPNGWSAMVHFPWMNMKSWMAWLLLYLLLRPLQSDPPSFLSLTLFGQPNHSLSLPLPPVGSQMGPRRKHTTASGNFWLPWMVSLQVRAWC